MLSRLLAVAAVAALLAGCAAPLPQQGAAGDGGARLRVEPFEVVAADGAVASGLAAYPADRETAGLRTNLGRSAGDAKDGDGATLVVIAHPWGATAAEQESLLADLAGQGVYGLAMDFRGDRSAFKVEAGVEDTVAATLAFQDAHPDVTQTLLYGWSMGGEIAMLAVAAAPAGTFDYVFDGAGVSDLPALWNEHSTLRPFIEQETGGAPAVVPGEYSARSPVDRVDDLAGKEVRRYFLVHGAGDGPVPVEQSERLYAALQQAGLPVSYYVVTANRDPWLCVPLVSLCTPGPTTGLANHEAGSFRLMQPFIEHRIERLPDPAEPAVRGTYDGETGRYEPSDVGP